jgi:alcohol dehydrogenase class IV
MKGNSFTFEYRPATIRQGPDAVDDIEAELETRDLSNALVVTDETMAGIDPVMDPIREGTGDAFAGVFDGVTPDKFLKAAYDGATRVREEGIDALVAVGGGSSLDIAKQIAVLDGHDRPLDDVVDEILEAEAMLTPEAGADLIDLFAVPTTIPGADLSQVAGVKLSMDPEGKSRAEVPSAGVSDSRLMPAAVFHDLELLSTTPDPILARSAMNGFDKGIEMLYTRHHNPLTDGTAVRGVRLLYEGLPAITDEETSEEDLATILQGIAAAQYGLSTPNAYRASIIHSFGHAISRNYPVQQGVAHAVAAPHVLEYIFEQIDGRRELLAEAFDVSTEGLTDEEVASAVVDAVAETRDALELPSELRSIEGTEESHFPELAQAVLEDAFMEAGPRDLDPTQAEIEAVFEKMW